MKILWLGGNKVEKSHLQAIDAPHVCRFLGERVWFIYNDGDAYKKRGVLLWTKKTAENMYNECIDDGYQPVYLFARKIGGI